MIEGTLQELIDTVKKIDNLAARLKEQLEDAGLLNLGKELDRLDGLDAALASYDDFDVEKEESDA